jgi:hypothetical protein
MRVKGRKATLVRTFISFNNKLGNKPREHAEAESSADVNDDEAVHLHLLFVH